MKLETERMILRPLDKGDFLNLKEIMQDPVTEKVYQRHFDDKAIEEWLLRQQQRYQKNDLGLLAMIRKEDEIFLGQAGLTLQPYKDTQLLEIGYLLKAEYRHQGYASEAARGLKKYAFQVLDAKKVYSMIKVDNIDSIHVAKANGMREADHFIKEYCGMKMEHILFQVENVREQNE